jgi:predicted nucleotidyltransferase
MGRDQSEPSALRELLRLHRRRIQRLAQANRLRNVQVFGSVARGDDGPDSDVDLLVDLEPGASYFDLAQFAMDLEQLLGRHVDVVSRGALDADRDSQILREAIALSLDSARPTGMKRLRAQQSAD